MIFSWIPHHRRYKKELMLPTNRQLFKVWFLKTLTGISDQLEVDEESKNFTLLKSSMTIDDVADEIPFDKNSIRIQSLKTFQSIMFCDQS